MAAKSQPSKETLEKVQQMKKRVESAITSRMDSVNQRRLRALRLESKLKAMNNGTQLSAKKKQLLTKKYYNEESMLIIYYNVLYHIRYSVLIYCIYIIYYYIMINKYLL